MALPLIAFALGAVAGVGAAVLNPQLAKQLRPALLAAMRAGMTAAQAAQVRAAELAESAEDLWAEMRAQAAAHADDPDDAQGHGAVYGNDDGHGPRPPVEVRGAATSAGTPAKNPAPKNKRSKTTGAQADAPQPSGKVAATRKRAATGSASAPRKRAARSQPGEAGGDAA